jgi:phosphotransferase system enzyme I (PtsI)
VGGRTSHTAILASALELPAVVGLETISGGVVGGETVIIDGNRGIVIVAPDERTLARYRRLQKELEVQEALVFRDRNLPAVTRDGREIRVLANIEFPEEIASVLAHGAQGVGLFRTEFLYLRNGVMPTEADHFEAYRRSLQELKGLPLTVRTLDLGADKVFPGEWHKEANPFLGLRSIRLSIRRPENFRVQVRAILRASALGPVRLLLPLISCLEELRWAQGIIEEVKRELTAARVGFAPEIPVGIMIEVPSAALMAQTLAQECDFLSIGTNDLVQYTVAVDRGNEHVAHLYTPAHPAVLKLIHSIIEAGRKADLAVGMCGEMAGDPLYVASLIGFGLTEFSVAPAMVPKVKTIVRNVDAKQAEQDAAALLGLEDSTAVLDHLRSAPRDHPSSAGTTG